MSLFDDPIPNEAAMPSTVAEFLALSEPGDELDLIRLAHQVEREEYISDAKFLLAVQAMPGFLGDLLRAIADARTAWRCAEYDEAAHESEYDRWGPVIIAAQLLADRTIGGAA